MSSKEAAVGTFCTWIAIIVLMVLGASAGAQEQRDETSALAQELASLLDRAGLDSMAGRFGETDEGFVAALYMPEQLLIVVSARYPSPSLLKEKILGGRYRDVYLDLHGATDPATRLVIEDLGVDGIQPRRSEGRSVDVYTKGGASPFAFDGEWKKRKLSEDAYRKMFDQVATEYADMLRALILQARSVAS
jgi:hypothetical protein